MLIKNIEITEIRLIRFDSKEKKFRLKFSFSDEPSLEREYKYELVDILPEKILSDIKQLKIPTHIDEDDSILGAINIALIKDDEEIKKSLLKSFLRIGQNLVNMKNITDANEYMKSFKAVNTHQEIIYKKI